jgi:uncharacterized membrane protein affecting hemolysin expression
VKTPVKEPLGRRLLRINLATLAVALAGIVLIAVTSGFLLNLHAIKQDGHVKAKVLAEYAGATIMFRDARAAAELLQSLAHSPDIHAAAIYDGTGSLFARYEHVGHSVPARAVTEIGRAHV